MADRPDGDELRVPLVRNLAVITQLHLPGTAGRLAQQVRDLEAAAPVYKEAGLVRKVDRPVPLTVHAAGIATETPPPRRIMGGFLYAAGAVRLDLKVEDNRVGTGTQNSVCEVDDIDFEDQRDRLRLIGIRQAYELADAAMRDGERRDLIVLDCPLLLSRSMAVPKEGAAHRGHKEAYRVALETVDAFWTTHQDRLYPWCSDGPIFVGVGTGRYGAVLQLAAQDLRTSDGRGFVLPGEPINQAALGHAEDLGRAVLSIGEQRFVQGILGPFTRTAAWRMNVQAPSMEPKRLAQEGVVGFHFKGAEGTSARLAHMLGSPQAWTTRDLDRLAGLLMAMSAVGGRQAEPLPILLARQELRPLPGFLEHYAHQVRTHLRSRKLEKGWLEGLDELD